jgi:hypothetical protein
MFDLLVTIGLYCARVSRDERATKEREEYANEAHDADGCRCARCFVRKRQRAGSAAGGRDLEPSTRRGVVL